MPLTLLEVEHFRLFEKIRLAPALRLNLIVGHNASGKTSLLEAIHLLGTGRSFRTTLLNQLIRHSSPAFLVSGQFYDDGVPATRLALQRDTQHSRFSLGGSPQPSASLLARTLPLQIISPDSHFQFFTNTRHRRGILDWGVFHVEPDFYGHWMRYQRTLNQRNAALKARQLPKACFAWIRNAVQLGVPGSHAGKNAGNLFLGRFFRKDIDRSAKRRISQVACVAGAALHDRAAYGGLREEGCRMMRGVVGVAPGYAVKSDVVLVIFKAAQRGFGLAQTGTVG